MKNFNFRALLIPVTIVVVSAVLFGAGFFARGLYDSKQEKAASEVASQFVDSVLAGDSDQAYGLMTPEYQGQMDKGLFGEIVKAVKTDSPEKKEASTVQNGDVVTYYQQVGNIQSSKTGTTEVGFLVTVSNVDGKSQISDATLQ